jgi:putative addiction module component (TIGR02574 family)
MTADEFKTARRLPVAEPGIIEGNGKRGASPFPRSDPSNALAARIGGCETNTWQIDRLEFGLDAGEIRMSLDVTSIFDLSPSEKLQLVEDLWDDLAATPEDVPVHDWQKEELARRKANLLKNSASGLSWEEVQRRVRSRYGR